MQIFESSRINTLSKAQLGKFSEYWVKLVMTMEGIDIYSAEVDEKGIDFIARVDSSRYIDVQVKSFRKNSSYVYIPTHIWKDGLRDNLYLALVSISEGVMPTIYLVPSKVWEKPNKIFVYHPYDKGQKSKPEWGINIPKKLELLEEFSFINQISKMKVR